jgi:hypothetical protein
MPSEISFKPKQVSKALLSSLPERARDVIRKRYGLDGERFTLEAIGQEYKITRERVRQIENFALKLIRQSNDFKAAGPIFKELAEQMEKQGAIVHEGSFLTALTQDPIAQNHIYLLLVIGEPFTRLKEDDLFAHRWTTDRNVAEKVHSALNDLHESLSANDLLAEEELIESFTDKLKTCFKEASIEPDKAKRWLSISKCIGTNPLGEWGLQSSPNVKIRGIRDCAFLVMRRHGSPMHFREIAQKITETFGKEAHPATCHNEVIKDSRFVLVGRGLYALTEWGYTKGVVRDVIREILKKDGPLTKEEIIQRVSKERYVKENTIVVNLQNPNYFKKNKDGKYLAV